MYYKVIEQASKKNRNWKEAVIEGKLPCSQTKVCGYQLRRKTALLVIFSCQFLFWFLIRTRRKRWEMCWWVCWECKGAYFLYYEVGRFIFIYCQYCCQIAWFAQTHRFWILLHKSHISLLNVSDHPFCSMLYKKIQVLLICINNIKYHLLKFITSCFNHKGDNN